MSGGRHVQRPRRRMAASGGSFLILSTALAWAFASTALATDTSAQPAGAATAPNGWTSAASAVGSANDNVYAVTSQDNAEQGYRDFNLSIPDGSIVDGITVQVEARSDDPSGCEIDVRLSGNGGSSYTSERTVNLTTTEAWLTAGGPSTDWSRAWDASQLSNANFRLKLQFQDGSNCNDSAFGRVDRLQVIVTYRTIDASGTANGSISAEACNSADFNFVIDMSGSIGAQDGVPSNLQQLKDGINGFVNAFEGGGGSGSTPAPGSTGAARPR